RLKAQGKRPGIQVIKEYGNLPKVECYAGQLNQVFMNLLTNAIDALEESAMSLPSLSLCEGNNKQLTTDFKPMIQIRTEVVNDNQVVIRIADNGAGIKEHVKARIFDPFFTTKPVGVGTGLGLSISYQIVVEKHRGQLHCFSEQRKGTEFLIQIPLWQSAS
ncbi:MAG: HAMP domain-containing histidine kinase, partial [Coleofasciculus sp. S288]|nr:HAMP domain-containing histidine kinase [Coleofasciculus sp. S288]